MSEKNKYKPGGDHYEKLKAKLFNEKEFNTLIIGGEPKTEKQQELEVIVTSITDKTLSSDERDEFYKIIKQKNGKEAVLEAFGKTKDPDKKALLMASLWEINFDMTSEFLFLVGVVCNEEFNVALEAFTVIENIEGGIAPADLEKARNSVSKKIKEQPETVQLLEDLLSFLDNSGH